MNGEYTEVTGQEIENLNQGRVVTLELDDMLYNIVLARNTETQDLELVIQHYGSYPYQILYKLLDRNNITSFVYQNVPNTEKCPISERLFRFWIEG